MKQDDPLRDAKIKMKFLGVSFSTAVHNFPVVFPVLSTSNDILKPLLDSTYVESSLSTDSAALLVVSTPDTAEKQRVLEKAIS